MTTRNHEITQTEHIPLLNSKNNNDQLQAFLIPDTLGHIVSFMDINSVNSLQSCSRNLNDGVSNAKNLHLSINSMFLKEKLVSQLANKIADRLNRRKFVNKFKAKPIRSYLNDLIIADQSFQPFKTLNDHDNSGSLKEKKDQAIANINSKLNEILNEFEVKIITPKLNKTKFFSWYRLLQSLKLSPFIDFDCKLTNRDFNLQRMWRGFSYIMDPGEDDRKKANNLYLKAFSCLAVAFTFGIASCISSVVTFCATFGLIWVGTAIPITLSAISLATLIIASSAIFLGLYYGFKVKNQRFKISPLNILTFDNPLTRTTDIERFALEYTKNALTELDKAYSDVYSDFDDDEKVALGEPNIPLCIDEVMCYRAEFNRNIKDEEARHEIISTIESIEYTLSSGGAFV